MTSGNSRKKAMGLRTGRVTHLPATQMCFQRIGLVSRNYNFWYPNRQYDFSHSVPGLLRILDDEKCDSVIFSPYSFARRRGFRLSGRLSKLKHIKMVIVEEFVDDDGDWGDRKFVVYLRRAGRWQSYPFDQIFAKLAGIDGAAVEQFARDTIPQRAIGNATL